MSSCQRPEQRRPPRIREDISSRSVSKDAGAAHGESAVDAGARGDAEDTKTQAPHRDAPTEGATPVGRWGVAINVPPSATSEHDAHAERHRIRLSYGVSVVLTRIDLPAPASLSEAVKAWNHEADVENLGEGVTPSGAFYGIRTFQVRAGMPGGSGRHKHMLQQVSRVHAVLALDHGSHVTCTGYVEHGVDTADDPDIQAVRKICLSMHKYNVRE